MFKYYHVISGAEKLFVHHFVDAFPMCHELRILRTLSGFLLWKSLIDNFSLALGSARSWTKARGVHAEGARPKMGQSQDYGPMVV